MLHTDKPTLLFLPALITDARLFQYQVASLTDVHGTVADLRNADNIPALAADVLAHAPEKFALAGLSLGGYVALEVMRQAPQRVTALALISTNARADTAEATANRHRLLALAEKDYPTVVRELVPKLLHPTEMADQHAVDTIVHMAERAGTDVFRRQQQAIIGRIDSRPHLSAIACPTLVMCGRDDVLTPLEVHEEMAAGIPDAELVVIESAAHLLTLGKPEIAAKALRGWLKVAKVI